ncbi:MAG: AAA family ATPase [Spirochaetia bacterium]|nr:AAA family ATPase [Spirochaetia bacterium]
MYKKVFPYIPDRILQQVNQNPPVIYRKEKLKGSILFIDIAGFSPLAESLSRKSGKTDRSAEILQEILTEYFTNILNKVRSYGGYTYQFAGDSVLIAMLQTNTETDEDCALRASSCAVDVMEKIRNENEQKVDHQVKLEVKISLSSGEIHQVTLGGKKNFLVSNIVGLPVEEAMEGERLAEKSEIVVSRKFWDLLPASRKGEIRGNFFVLKNPGVLINYNIDQSIFNHDLLNLKTAKHSSRFLSKKLLNKIIYGSENFLGDFREVTAVFAGFDKNREIEKLTEMVGVWNNLFIKMQTIADDYSGTIVQADFSDKGIVFLILFGAPVGLEKKEMMACNFSLKMMENITDFPQIDNFRIGISTGKSYCGDLGASFRKGYTIVSKSANLASRLMTFGEAEEIHIDYTTRSKIDKGYSVQKIEKVKLKGIDVENEIFKLKSKEDAAKNDFLEIYSDPMIGRQNELRQILLCFEKSREGSTQILSITGDAGLGKSRLTAAFLETIKDKEINIIHTACYPYEINTAFFVWREILENLFFLNHDDAIDQKLQTIEETIQKLPDVNIQWARAIAVLMGINTEEKALTKELKFSQKKERIFQIILELIKYRSFQNQILIVVEDLHWIDETSFQLFQYLFTHLQNEPVLFIIILRPWENISYIQNHENHTDLNLNELSEEDALELIRQKLNLEDEQQQLEHKILINSHGNPFFIESIIYNLKEDKILLENQNGKFKVNHSIDHFKIPDSLNDVILSRLDRLKEEEQALLKTAAVIGRIFLFDLLKKMTPEKDSNTIQKCVSVLETLDLTPVESDQPLSYIFKHIVIRDVAYNSLLLSTRRLLHARLAEVFEEEYKENNSEIIESLAYHFYEGNIMDKALYYTFTAAEKSFDKNASKEALFYYEKAFELSLKNPDCDYEQIFSIKQKMAAANRNLGNFTASQSLYQECLDYYTEDVKAAEIKTGMGINFQETGDAFNAIEKLEEALKHIGMRAPKNKNAARAGLLGQLMIRGIHNYFPFFIRTSLKNRRKYELRSKILMTLQKIYFFKSVENVAWAGYAHVNLAERLQTPYDLSLGYSFYATILLSLGFFKRARKYLNRALKISEKSENQYCMGLTLQRMSFMETYFNNIQEIIKSAEKSIKYLKQIGETWDMMTSYILLGIGHYFAGNLTEGVQSMKEMEDIANHVRSKIHQGWAAGRKGYYQYLKNEINFNEIEEIINDSVSKAKESQDIPGLITIYMFHTMVLLLEKRSEEALSKSEEEYKTITEYGLQIPHIYYGLISIIDSVSENIRSENNSIRIRSKSLFNKSFKLLNKYQHSYKIIEGPAHRALAKYYYKTGNRKKAISEINKSLDILKNSGNKLEHAFALYDASVILENEEFKLKSKILFEECSFRVNYLF